MFKRKIYDKMLEWKQTSEGRSALLIEGARRIGKSTVAEAFAKNEYDSYIMIDFAKASKEIRDLFEDVSNLNYLFLQLQLKYRVDLHERKSLIILQKNLRMHLKKQVIPTMIIRQTKNWICPLPRAINQSLMPL